MNAPTDLADLTSTALATLVEHVLDDPERREPATLATVQSAISAGLIEDLIRQGELDEAERDAIEEELDNLITEYGEDVAAVHVLRFRASRPMSALIRQLAARRVDLDHPVTLIEVREAIDAGVPAELVGDGVIDAEEEDGLAPEADELIRMHGEEALAEEIIGAEGDSPGV